MENAQKILQINLLHEFISKLSSESRTHLSPKIETLFANLENQKLSSSEAATLSSLKELFSSKLVQKYGPLEQLQRRNLKRAFLKLRGLVFDLKTRFDYSGPQVAIQDGLDLAEYVKEVIEEINDDLKQNLASGTLSTEESQVIDTLANLYCQFSRERLTELFPSFVETLQVFQKVMDDKEIAVT